MAKTTKTEKVLTKEEFGALCDQIVAAQKKRGDIVQLKQAQEIQLNELYDPRIKELDETIKVKMKLAAGFAMKNRAELLKPGRSSGASTLAEFGFADSPESLELKNKNKLGWKDVVALLLKRGLERFLRTPEPEVDKDALRLSGLSEAELEELGVKRASKTTFWVRGKVTEPSRDAVQTKI